MNRSKKIFLVGCALFAAFLAIVSYDIGSRTTFPGSKSQLKERLKKKYSPADSIQTDTVMSIQR
jgi:hypothetical protein